MSYHAGIGGSLAVAAGVEPREPHIRCDRCGATRSVYRSRKHFAPARWLLDGKPAPGWAGGRRDDGTRYDVCPQCREDAYRTWDDVNRRGIACLRCGRTSRRTGKGCSLPEGHRGAHDFVVDDEFRVRLARMLSEEG